MGGVGVMGMQDAGVLLEGYGKQSHTYIVMHAHLNTYTQLTLTMTHAHPRTQALQRKCQCAHARTRTHSRTMADHALMDSAAALKQ